MHPECGEIVLYPRHAYTHTHTRARSTRAHEHIPNSMYHVARAALLHIWPSLTHTHISLAAAAAAAAVVCNCHPKNGLPTRVVGRSTCTRWMFASNHRSHSILIMYQDSYTRTTAAQTPPPPRPKFTRSYMFALPIYPLSLCVWRVSVPVIESKIFYSFSVE